MKLQGKAAVVPGGGSVFGAGIVRKFVAEGARVVVADLNLDAAQTVAAAAGDAACAVRADVASAADTHAMLEAAPRLTAHVPGSGDLRGAILNRASTAGFSPRQRVEPGGRRDPAAEDLHGLV
jgi:NAD(P)-dependent dehydrogenase (short-subunit alcohol dehydrogenase family)